MSHPPPLRVTRTNTGAVPFTDAVHLARMQQDTRKRDPDAGKDLKDVKEIKDGKDTKDDRDGKKHRDLVGATTPVEVKRRSDKPIDSPQASSTNALDEMDPKEYVNSSLFLARRLCALYNVQSAYFLDAPHHCSSAENKELFDQYFFLEEQFRFFINNFESFPSTRRLAVFWKKKEKLYVLVIDLRDMDAKIVQELQQSGTFTSFHEAIKKLSSDKKGEVQSTLKDKFQNCVSKHHQLLKLLRGVYKTCEFFIVRKESQESEIDASLSRSLRYGYAETKYNVSFQQLSTSTDRFDEQVLFITRQVRELMQFGRGVDAEIAQDIKDTLLAALDGLLNDPDILGILRAMCRIQLLIILRKSYPKSVKGKTDLQSMNIWELDSIKEMDKFIKEKLYSDLHIRISDDVDAENDEHDEDEPEDIQGLKKTKMSVKHELKKHVGLFFFEILEMYKKQQSSLARGFAPAVAVICYLHQERDKLIQQMTQWEVELEQLRLKCLNSRMAKLRYYSYKFGELSFRVITAPIVLAGNLSRAMPELIQACRKAEDKTESEKELSLNFSKPKKALRFRKILFFAGAGVGVFFTSILSPYYLLLPIGLVILTVPLRQILHNANIDNEKAIMKKRRFFRSEFAHRIMQMIVMLGEFLCWRDVRSLIIHIASIMGGLGFERFASKMLDLDRPETFEIQGYNDDSQERKLRHDWNKSLYKDMISELVNLERVLEDEYYEKSKDLPKSSLYLKIIPDKQRKKELEKIKQENEKACKALEDEIARRKQNNQDSGEDFKRLQEQLARLRKLDTEYETIKQQLANLKLMLAVSLQSALYRAGSDAGYYLALGSIWIWDYLGYRQRIKLVETFLSNVRFDVRGYAGLFLSVVTPNLRSPSFSRESNSEPLTVGLTWGFQNHSATNSTTCTLTVEEGIPTATCTPPVTRYALAPP